MSDKTPQQRLQALRRRGMIELERCRRSVLYWAERYAWTRDEADKTGHSYKPLIAGPLCVDPKTLEYRTLTDSPNDYLRWLTVMWELERLWLIEKSRQLRVSWWNVAMDCWLVQFSPAQRVGYRSKQLGDADKMLDRGVVILELQRTVAPWVPWPQFRKKQNLLKVVHGGLAEVSRMEALPQGAGKIRGEAYSAVGDDELAFQVEAEEGYAAAMPLIEGGARYGALSSAQGSTFFQRLRDDAA